MAYPGQDEQNEPDSQNIPVQSQPVMSSEPTGSTDTTRQPLGIDNPKPLPPTVKARPPILLIVIGLVIFLILAGLIFSQAKHKKTTDSKVPANPSTVIQPAASITITATGFTPATIKIKQGQSVTWTNQDNLPHQIASDPFPSEDAVPGFKAETPQNKSETYSFTFNKPGTFTYHDHLNPLKLKGTVVVE